MVDKRIKNSEISKLSEFNKQEAIGWVIERLNHIEADINEIITRYFDPSNHKEFNRIVLNSSILSLGNKLKILRNISSFEKNIPKWHNIL